MRVKLQPYVVSVSESDVNQKLNKILDDTNRSNYPTIEDDTVSVGASGVIL